MITWRFCTIFLLIKNGKNLVGRNKSVGKKDIDRFIFYHKWYIILRVVNRPDISWIVPKFWSAFRKRRWDIRDTAMSRKKLSIVKFANQCKKLLNFHNPKLTILIIIELSKHLKVIKTDIISNNMKKYFCLTCISWNSSHIVSVPPIVYLIRNDACINKHLKIWHYYYY